MGRPQLVLVGDSHLAATSSRGVTELDPRLRRAGWKVLNLAVGGATTRDALETVDEAMPVGSAVFSFGTNDSAPWKQVPLDEFRRNYGRLLRRPRGEIVVGPSPVSEPLARPMDVLGDEDDVLLDDGVHLSDVAYEKLAELVLAALDTAEL